MFLKMPHGDDEWVFVNFEQVTYLVWHQEVNEVTAADVADGRAATGVSVTFYFTGGQSVRVSNLAPAQAAEIGRQQGGGPQYEAPRELRHGLSGPARSTPRTCSAVSDSGSWVKRHVAPAAASAAGSSSAGN